MTIRYHLVKNMPASRRWEDPSKWTMLVEVNGVRVGHLTLEFEELMRRLRAAHGELTLERKGLSLLGGRDVTYCVSEGEVKSE